MAEVLEVLEEVVHKAQQAIGNLDLGKIHPSMISD